MPERVNRYLNHSMPVVVGMPNGNMCNDDMQCIHNGLVYGIVLLTLYRFP